jgi:hypothetical protein
MDPAKWLLLIHQIPPKPDYFRVKVRRRLRRVGAAPLKDSVYLLPYSEDALEDFQWLAQEIRTDGGEAVVVEASFINGITEEELQAMFKNQEQAVSTPGIAHGKPAPSGGTWVTRVGVKVDRIASAWLVRSFIDRDARFKFVPARGYRPAEGELRFDMFEAEYTHEGERCTFEVLLERFGLTEDEGLVALAEIVHDIDCKDERFRRPETAGVAALIEAVAASQGDDQARIDRGGAIFADLYATFRRRDVTRG